MIQNKQLLVSQKKAMDQYPYYAPGIMHEVFHEDNNVPTMGTSAKFNIVYNSTFVKKLDPNDLAGILVHEALHVLRDHHHRWKINRNFGKISPTIANIAMDIEINQVLADDSDYIKSNGFLPESLDLPKGKAFEEYLEIIWQKMKARQQGESFNGPESESKNKGSNGNGNGSKNNNCSGENIDQLLDDMNKNQEAYEKTKKVIDQLSKSVNELDMSDSMTDQDDEINQEQIQSVIDEIKTLAKGHGNEHSCCDIIRTVQKKKYNWKQVLSSVLKHKAETIMNGFDHYTYSKPNEKSQYPVVLPSSFDEEVSINLVIGVDVSGSMGHLVEEMYARLKSIKNQISSESHIIVVECDTEISNVMYDFNPMQTNIKSTNGGGTDMNAIPKWVDENWKNGKIPEPGLIVIMTDNECYWEKDNPLKDRTVVLTTEISEDCPYKQYEVVV